VFWRVLRYELVMWQSLYRWVFRRPGPPGDRFPYASVVTPVIIAFIVVSAIELPIAHLLVPWPTVRQVLLVLGIYGLLWMIGMLASYRVNPHSVDGDGLHIRTGGTVHVVVPWEAIDSVRMRRRAYEGSRSVRVEGEGPARVLAFAMGSQTTLDVVLSRPLPLLAFRGDAEPVGEVRLHADDEKALTSRLRAGLAERRPAA
jgi:hypothetical protein